MMIIQLIPQGNTVQMYGGPNPNGWSGPWVTDTILGLLVPVMIVLSLTSSLTVTGVPMVCVLFAYNILGAYDYAHGLLTQYLEPQQIFLWKPAVPTQIYGSILFGCICNIVCAMMLLHDPVVSYFKDC